MTNISEIRKLAGEGILKEQDIQSLGTQRKRVLRLMEDGEEHSGPAIVRASGGSEGLRRLRELRELPGVEIEKRRDSSGRFFWYRMVRDEDIWEAEKTRKQALSYLLRYST